MHYLDPYRSAHDEHGPAFGVTLWANPASQRRRFEVFAEMLHLSGKRILDAGCSRGDFAAWMVQNDLRYSRYVGIDGLTEVIEYANQRGLPDAEFHTGDLVHDREILHTADPQVIAVSGTLNTMTLDTALTVLDHCWAAASEALIFNFLSDRTGHLAIAQQAPARRLPTMKLLDWAFSRTWNVQFRQDYFPHGHDATILMKHGG